MHFSTFAAMFCAATLALTVGCDQADWGELEGTVLLNGNPVGPGSITLEPIDGSHAGAVATFGEDGKYTAMSAGRRPGAKAGEYRVLIRGGENLTAETAEPQPPSKIPARYGRPGESDLTVSIEPGDNTKDFDLQP